MTTKETTFPSTPQTLLNTPTEQIKIGMNYQQVASLIKGVVVVGYKESSSDPSGFEPIALKNPFRVEVIKNDAKEYEAFYYLAGIRKLDGVITDDELMPVVFEGGRVIGKGWDFLWKIKKK